ncbi:hypothetical protein G8O24_34950 [Bradyrhizobium sp. INPA01-394B]|uniref:Transposase n=1 Tax=Bradyrhizobium campsiandrae TaxID=1729892 RepID=A0ABR7UIG7_9BRAD|nr:hypothetical protein [Bradyrhizobium campsiandrae]MBC9882509.1 hypothetical protein [Bradyrhizobium campsiandrae]MBC9983386.1 hypothetical protein [Bradyrhizobium campsiandrae]
MAACARIAPLVAEFKLEAASVVIRTQHFVAPLSTIVAIAASRPMQHDGAPVTTVP